MFGKHLAALVSVLFLAAVPAHAAENWTEGKQYFLIQPTQRTSVPAGKVEVTEVFSYGCIGCNQFQPFANQLKKSLPANAQFVCVAASWIEQEDWPVFQRAYYAAQALGVADRAHDAMFDAIWKTGELAIIDPKTQRPKKTLPTIEDVAKLYARVTGVKAEEFVALAKSFTIELKMKQADQQVKAYRAESTPTLVVNGKYRLTPNSAGSYEKSLELVKWLVAKETK